MAAVDEQIERSEEELAALMSPEGIEVEPGLEVEPDADQESAEDGEESEEGEESEDGDPSSFTVTEQLSKAIDAEGKRHERALAKALGEKWEDYELCLRCLGDGFVLPIPAGQMPQEQWDNLMAQAGMAPGDQLKTATYAIVCSTCDGWGEIKTGSKSASQAVLPCKDCQGRGWFDSTDISHAPPAQPAAPAATQWAALGSVLNAGTAPAVEDIAPPAGWATAGSPGADEYGRWPGHPRYGINPATGGW